MSFTIRVPNELYKRLESHAIGFDSSIGVIKGLLDHYEEDPEKNH